MKKVYVFIAMLIGLVASAQQDPQYTQYMYNMNVVNPAYAGNHDGLAIGALYRSQWVGLQGAPETATLNVHSPVSERVGLGMSFINDRIGPVNETNAYADFSYTLPINDETKLALGLKAGATFHKIGLSNVNLAVTDAGDPFFQQNISSATPNVGAGAYYYKPNKYYVSLSVPNILNSAHINRNGTKIGSETSHMFFAAGYVFSLSENYKLKPHTIVKYALNAPISFDINANLFMFNLVEVGIGYRLSDSITGLVNFAVTPNLKIGYAYDRVTSNLNVVTTSSHEIFINYSISKTKRVSRSPRYF